MINTLILTLNLAFAGDPCVHPRTGDSLCDTKIMFGEVPALTKSETETCSASMIAIIDVVNELQNKTLPYVRSQSNHINSQKLLAENGYLDQIQIDELNRKIDRFNYQMAWVEKVLNRLEKVEESTESCQEKYMAESVDMNIVELQAKQIYKTIMSN